MGPLRSFDELRADADWCTTLAYWLGLYSAPLDTRALAQLAEVMSLQYDYEEQADAFGRALPEDQGWTRVFRPIAPVQLALRWSPLACATAILGEPTADHTQAGIGPRAAVVAWDATRVSTVTSTARSSASADEKRFLGLLTVAVTRAQGDQRGLLIVAKPGWSYADIRTVSRETIRLMEAAGFVRTDRRPQAG